MYYQVSDCVSQEIYEEREYKCLGHWSEAELLYTYTQRRDVAAGTYECFVGSIISDTEIFIKEAGEHCQRQADPLKYVMRLNKQGQGMYSCIGTCGGCGSITDNRVVCRSRPQRLARGELEGAAVDHDEFVDEIVGLRRARAGRD